jgi:hypothetical protein
MGRENAVGNTITTNAGNAAADGAGSVVINAIGMAAHDHPAVLPPAKCNRAGTIGGPARNVSGALNSTDFQPRHP